MLLLLLLLLFTPAILSVEPEGNPLSNGNIPEEEKVEFATAIDGDPEVKKNENGIVWSDWIVATPCSDTCGACGMTHLIRECLCAGEEGCPCSEREFRVEVCAKKLCTFPRRSCCEGFKKTATATALQCEPIHESIERKIIEKESLIASKKFIEVKKEEVKTEVANDEQREWGEWTVDTPCTDTCGSCGNTNLVRQCLCVGREGCPCSERETRVEVCGTGLCEFPRKTCCEGYKKVSTPNGFKCALKENETKKGVEETTQKQESLVHSRPNPRVVHLKRKEVSNINSEAPKQRAAKTHRIDPISLNRVEDSPWSAWIVSINCTDTCGACGTITYSRSCLCAGEDDCPCSHLQTRTDVCGIGLCSFPRHTCCAPAKKTLTPNGFQCLTEETIQPSDNVIVSNPKNQSDALNDIPEVTGSPSKREHLAVWGQWLVNTPCTDTCGSCGRIHLTRECLCAGEEGCPCSQRESRVEVCGTELCGFPRHTCCKGFIKIPTPDGFRCAAENESNERVCAGQFTPWAEVESVSECPAKCGMCGKRKVATRKCEPDHCECSGETELFESCGRHPCREGGKECCDGFVKGRVDGREECVPNASIPPSLSVASRKFLDRKKAEERKEMEGRKVQLRQILPVLDSPSNCTWGEWTEIESECSGSCGMCGVRISARRNCFPIGCNCVGPSTRYEDCGEGICQDREKPCCGYYTPSTINGVSTCVDPVGGGVKGKTPNRRTEVKKTERDTLSTSTCRGIWSPFTASPSSHCDSPCGLCGHRSVAERECIPHGCSCQGSNKLYERCGEKPCWNKKEGCCEGASIVLVDGKRICKEIN